MKFQLFFFFLVLTQSGQRLTVLKNVGQPNRQQIHQNVNKSLVKVAVTTTQSQSHPTISQPLGAALVQHWKSGQSNINNTTAVNNIQENHQPKIKETEFFVVSYIYYDFKYFNFLYEHDMFMYHN